MDSSVQLADTLGHAIQADGEYNESLRLVHLDFGALLPLIWHSGEEFSPVGNEQTGLHSWRRRDARDMVIMIGIPLLEDVEGALTSEYVDACPGRIVKEIV